MSIRVGVIDGNREFFERFRAALRDQYPGEFEIYLFPDLAKAALAVEKFRIRVVLVEPTEREGPPADLSEQRLPATAVFVRLVDRMQLEKEWTEAEENEGASPQTPVLCRYRSTDEWRELLLAYDAQVAPDTDRALTIQAPGGGVSGDRKPYDRTVLFTSAAGGVGTSTAARAFAAACQRRSRHVLCLDLQAFPAPHPEAASDDLFTMEDVVLSLRGHKYTPDAVIARAIRTDEDYGAFIPPAKNPAALFDLTGEEIVTLIDIIKELKRFSVLILDMPFDTSERAVLPCLHADKIVLVDDGMPIANRKTRQLLELLPGLCAEEPLEFYEKTCLIYNRFRNGMSTVLETEIPLKLGGIGELDIPDRRDLEDELSRTPAMDRLYEKLML